MLSSYGAEHAFHVSLSIAPFLHQDIQDLSVLVHGTPQVVALPPDPDEEFVDMPRVPGHPLQ